MSDGLKITFIHFLKNKSIMQLEASQTTTVPFVLRTFAQGIMPTLEVQAKVVHTITYEFESPHRPKLEVLLASIEHVRAKILSVPSLENLRENEVSDEEALQEFMATSLLNLLVHEVEFLLTVEERIFDSLESVCPLRHKSQFNLLSNGIVFLRDQLESVLVMAHNQANGLDLARNEFNFLETILYAYDCTKLLASHKKGVQIKFKFECELVSYRGARTYILQVLSLLLTNAVKFTDEGVITLSITKDDDCIYCNVVDTGVGLTEEELEKMLNYSDLPRKMIVGKGPVIGLLYATQLAKLLRGQITAKSEKLRGSHFCLRLPLN